MRWIRGPMIGRGSCAVVSAGATAESGKIFAVKSAELSKSGMLRQEKAMLSCLHCPQIISEMGDDITCENGALFYNVFLEFAPGGSLFDSILSHGGRLEEMTIRAYTRSILMGLDYLHSNGVVHCDIKCRNILITGDGPKISDFSCAKWRGSDLVGKPLISGTPAYMAPEAARGEQQSFPSDVWSLGCTVLAMATGKDGWSEFSDPISALYQIGFSNQVPEIPSFLSSQAQDFLSKCLRRNPLERWPANDLLKHDFVFESQSLAHRISTPANILDGRSWEAEQEPATWKLKSLAHRSSSPSPIERIKQLADDNKSLTPWNLEGPWFPVREDGKSRKDYPVSCQNSPWNDWDHHQTNPAFGKANGKSGCNSKGNFARGTPDHTSNAIAV